MTTISARAERLLAPRHTAYVVLGGVVAALAAPVVWTLIGLATGLLVVVVGIVFAGLLLLLSEALTRWHRARAGALLGVVIDVSAAPNGGGWRAQLTRLRRASTWRQLAYHAVVAPTLLTASAALLALCWGGGLVLAAAPLWARVGAAATSSPTGVLEGVGRIWGATVIGVGAILLAPRLSRVLAALDLAIVRPMLGATRGEQLSPRVTQLEQTRAGVIDAADAERRRIERDLHDGAQQRLVSLALNLGMARRRSTPDAPTETRRAIEEAHDEAKQALAELRGFVRGLHPAVLAERGLDAALSAIVARSPVPTSLHVLLAQPPAAHPRGRRLLRRRRGPDQRREALRGHRGVRARHVRRAAARRRGQRQRSRRRDDRCRLGPHGPDDRVAAVDGTLAVTSPAGGPTVLRAELPCAS